MDDEHLYNEWKERRRQVAVPEGFSNRVITKLLVESTPQPAKGSYGVRSFIMRWAISVSLTLLGLIRLSFVTYNLLVP